MNDAPEQDIQIDPDQKHVLNLYAAFGVSLLLAIVPSLMISIIALLFILGVLIAAYWLRSRAAAESLSENHATYIIRTIWISTFVSSITLTIGSAYMLAGIDYTAFTPCAQSMAAQGPEFAQSASFQQIFEIAEPCMSAFIDFNLALLTITAVITQPPFWFIWPIAISMGCSGR